MRDVERYADWISDSDRALTDEETAARVEKLMDSDLSIHYHSWTQTEILMLLADVRDRVDFDVEAMIKNEGEVILVLRKLA